MQSNTTDITEFCIDNISALEILQNLRMIAVMLDREGNIVFCNDFLLELTGWDRCDIMGKNWFDIFLPEDMRENIRRNYIINISRDALPKNYENSILSKLGEKMIISWNNTTIRDDNNVVIGSTRIGEDVTARYLYQEKLKKLNDDKDKFFSIIAHDLKSPFTALLGFSEYLVHYLEELSADEIRDFALNIYKSANGVFRLIENLLQWSRFQLGTMEFAPANFHFTELADELSQLYQANAIKKKLQLEFDFEPGLIAFADKNMIETVIRNLISNAIKFTNSGGRIRLIAHKVENLIEVEVIDNGIGISKENISKLFKISEKFTTKGTENEKGTGLGLMLCKEFVEKNGGSIMVITKPGEGSHFIFTIPMKKEN